LRVSARLSYRKDAVRRAETLKLLESIR